MDMDRITAKEFRSRIEALCLKRDHPGLPRRRRDQLILLASIVLPLDRGKTYSEKEINAAIERWLADVGRALDSDHVTLRRLLVDEGLLVRDPAGEAYRVSAAKTEEMIEPEVTELDPRQIIEAAQARREERKRRYLATERAAKR